MKNRKSCGILIKKIHTTLEKNANNSLREADLTSAQVSVLLTLNNAPDGKMTLKELEKSLMLAQSTVAGTVSRLEQKGFVQYFNDTHDKRIKFATITQDGKDCCIKAEENMTKAETQLLGGLTETEKEIFLSLLEKVSNSLK